MPMWCSSMPRNRDRVFAQPLGTSRRLANIFAGSPAPIPAGAERVAEMDGSGHYGDDNYGWMLRLAGGNLVYYGANGVMRMLDQRKAEEALSFMELMAAAGSAADLAQIVKEWRGDMTVEQAAALIGLPARTLNGIEQGRGFRYPQLLMLALSATQNERAPSE